MDHRKDLPIPLVDDMKLTYTENLTAEEIKERNVKKEEEAKTKKEQ